MNDFQVQIKQPVIISGNFEEMQQELSNMMQAYAGLEVTEANLPERKKDIATLRKIKTAIEDKRKAAKKDYEKPFKAFESECKKLTGIIDKEIDRINADMDVYEKKRIADKKLTIAHLYAKTVGDFAEYIPLESIYRQQWDNKTYSENAIICDIQEACLTVRDDLKTIENFCGEWAEECKAVYLGSGNNLNAALQRAKDLDTAKKAAESRLQAAEQQTPSSIPVTPAEPPEVPLNAEKQVWKFTVYNEDDAKFIRQTCEAMSIDFKEE